MPQKHINTDMSDMKNSDTFRVSAEKLSSKHYMYMN